ncbi:cysteine desulfurase family protein [Mycolicibacterium smegmatis]|uniref:Cysteine desulfurase IscS n=2 Tax=Mycolicibacterium smegmatis (strain ATCC 700084 / mc(2)155) TaxID=246196 RepID=A0QRU5_MYCS2|nr:cysteine desulfurase family protein [Mycolicibacterium smegmatis]ABK73857.1 cysteine desulfurase IscS [Mycolicibacterium smegmatis MC2 155]AFP37683.1 NifS-like class-V aminotransferase, probable cysteine desulfurase [Mycolicibacterium smegmatis MC2 155]AIU06487.1 cysteine desulfurase [Mycolicibacterium smegmatis MC2 155]AIU13112.1 cysteine desulfurase [Mycolicibacterium smegmatis]AIU19736.1 cysteine desulfurase [Mycolicibacterium smegmatis]
MVYLDYNASTPVDQRILPVVVESYGAHANAASTHHIAGRAAAELLEEARSRVAALVARSAQDVIFTSGATEAAVLGLVGAVLGASGRPNVVVGATEHKAISAAAELGARLSGGEVRTVRANTNGVVDLTHVEALVDDSVALVAVMAANNETGVLNPVGEVAEVARTAGALCFIDATQLVGKGNLDVATRSADLMVMSSHKIYGPKGAGALIANRSVQKSLVAIASGGGQERGLRGGTHNTPSLVGFGLAAELAAKEQVDDAARLGKLASELLVDLQARLTGVTVNGGGAARLSNTLNLRFEGADAEAVMTSMPSVQVSAGSACQSAVPMPSHVLLAMGMSGTAAAESLRISLGRPTTHDEIKIAGDAIVEAVTRVRELTRDEETRE